MIVSFNELEKLLLAILSNGKIVKTGNAELGVQVEKTGYSIIV